MREVRPKRPQNLNPYARELLDALEGHAEAADIVLGGGVALSHYLEYRGTVDADAWWRKEANAVTRHLLQVLMEDLALKHSLKHRLRVWGDTESYELLDGNRKVFSFQISTRTHYLSMTLDESVYPDMETPPTELTTLEERADYVHRVCSAFDFGVFPEADDWRLFAAWSDVFDRFPLPHSPAYHTFRAFYGWAPAPRGTHGLTPGWKVADLLEGREDPCEGSV